jgi:precorrin-6B methylase 2
MAASLQEALVASVGVLTLRTLGPHPAEVDQRAVPWQSLTVTTGRVRLVPPRHDKDDMLKRLAWRALETVKLDSVWLTYKATGLVEDGWIRSRREQQCVDATGHPLPWITYPAIDFLSRHTRPEMTVFEYGCGASTLWWAARVSRVVAVEHDPEWARRIAGQAPANTTVIFCPLEPEGPYEENARAHGIRFDIVVIDGRKRVKCVPHAVAALGPGGVIVYDNTDRPEYLDGLRALAGAGFKRVEFIGLAPMVDFKSETSVFFRNENCLGI